MAKKATKKETVEEKVKKVETVGTEQKTEEPTNEVKEVIKGYQKACRVVSKLQEIYKPYIVES